jgi:hypothetical protein
MTEVRETGTGGPNAAATSPRFADHSTASSDLARDVTQLRLRHILQLSQHPCVVISPL